MSTLIASPNSIHNETENAVYAIPATPLQVRLWNLYEALGPDPAWNVAVRFRLTGELDRDNFERAFQFLAARHEVLRTSFTRIRDSVVQRIAARVALPVEWCDLRSWKAEAQAAEIENHSLAHARQLFSLENASLLRIRVLRLKDEEHLLLWNAHHSICDGWSVGLLASDLMECYSQLLSGSEPAARNSLDYGDYSVWMAAQRSNPEYETHRSYWKQLSRGIQAAALPEAWCNSEAADAAPVILSRLLPRTLTDSLSTVAQRNDATFFHTVLAAFTVVIWMHQQAAEVVLGTPMSGRDQAELESIVGSFVNYLPVRFRVDPAMRFRTLLQAVRDHINVSFDHAQFRYEDMLTDLKKKGVLDSAEKHLFHVAFICQRDFVHPITAAGISLTAIPSVSPGALRPLTVFLVERVEGWRVSCEVDNRVVSAAAGSAILNRYLQVLAAVAEHADDSVALLAARAGLKQMQSTFHAATLMDNGSQQNENVSQMDIAILDTANPIAKKGCESADDVGCIRIPATEFQRRFWRLDRLNPGAASFHVRIRLELNGPLDLDALAAAVGKLTQRHEILRTTLEEQDGLLWQVIHPEIQPDFRFLVSETLSCDESKPIAQRISDQAILDREGQAGFLLTQGPLFRIRVLQLDKNRHWLAITLSHAIADGWSSGLFLEQLQRTYEGCLTGVEEDLLTQPMQFSVYAASERKLLASTEKEHRLTWWRRHLAGTWMPLALPRDKDGATSGEGEVRAVLESMVLPSSSFYAVRRFAKECQTTSFAVFGALFQALLARYSGQNDILFLTPLANRTDNTETIMGPLADPICLTTHLDSQTTFRDLVTRLSIQSMDAMELALPLNVVAPLLDVRVMRAYHPLNQITFFYQRAFVHDMEWKGLQIKTLPDIPSVTDSEWQLGVVERQEGVFLEFLYDATLYSQAMIQRVLSHYVRLLAHALLQPDAQLTQLQILAPGELTHHSAGQPLLPDSQSLLPRTTSFPLIENENVAPSVMPAHSQSEHEMLQAWRELFRIEGLGIEANFFDLGGHSLLLARLQTVMERDFGVRLTAADVFRQPTVATLAAWLDRARSSSGQALDTKRTTPVTDDRRVVPIQPRGTERPIFVISQSMVFRTLADELGPAQPVYSLQMLDEDITPAMASASFEQLAGFYMRLIRQVQPKGPYRLAGWCLAGWIAYEVARQLEQQGEEIEMLMITDAWAPTYWRKQPWMRGIMMQTVYRGQRFLCSGRRLLRGNTAQRNAYIRRNLHGLAASAARSLTTRLHRLNLPVQVRLTEEMRRSELLEYTASRVYNAGPLKGTALLFRSERQPSGPWLAPDMGWSQVLGRSITVTWLPGSEVFDQDGSRIMASYIREVLGGATSRGSTSYVTDHNATPQLSPQKIPFVEGTCVR